MATTHPVTIVHDPDAEDGQAHYEPDPIIITAGDSIVWENKAHMEHTASRHEDPGRFDTGVLFPGDPPSAPQLINDVSDAAGFSYGCDIHPGMRGTVIVNAQLPPEPEEPHRVRIVHDPDAEDGQAHYEPDPVIITAGDSIVWENLAHMEHTASRHEDPGRFDTEVLFPGDLSAPQQINDVSDEAGFEYGCDIHPGMRGKVVVQPKVTDVGDPVGGSVTKAPRP